MKLAMTDRRKIPIASREMVCHHEAGHAVIALLRGARVSRIHVGKASPYMAGMLGGPSCELIALGGLATEMALVNSGLVVDSEGRQFVVGHLYRHWAETCLGDVRIWAEARADRHDTSAPPDEGWTRRFFNEAAELARNMHFGLTSPIVEALENVTWLAGKDVENLVQSIAPASLDGKVQRWLQLGYVEL